MQESRQGFNFVSLAWILTLAVGSIPGFAQNKKQPSPQELAKKLKEYPLGVEVTNSEEGIWAQNDWTCTNSDGQRIGCRAEPAPLPGQNRQGMYAFVTVNIANDTLILHCDERWVWSYCRGLPRGSYHGKWVNKSHSKITILYYWVGKKEDSLETVTYEIPAGGFGGFEGAGPIPGNK
jgi:hypothetical protein